jgi:hypothetical protein
MARLYGITGLSTDIKGEKIDVYHSNIHYSPLVPVLKFE